MSKRGGLTYEYRKAVMPQKVKAAIETGDSEQIGDCLNPRQKAFAQNYIQCFNASKAVVDAGYNTKYPEKVGHQMLDNPKVRAYIDQLLVDRSDLIDVDVNYVVKKITRAIEKCDQMGRYNEVLRGAELLAKYLGMFVERTEITGKDGGPIEYEKVKEDADAFSRTIAQLAARSGEDGISERTKH
jgi:phage terminase small subunit